MQTCYLFHLLFMSAIQEFVVVPNKRFNLKPSALAVACVIVPFSSLAEESQTLAVTQVWGTQIQSSSSLLQEDIDLKQADHLSDLLRDQAGVDVGGSHSINQGINIRGISELDLNVTIDGASQNNNVFHHAGTLLVNPDILKTVDINLGNNSVLNGGLGGGVAFETKDAKDLLLADQTVGARLFGGFATNDYYNYSGTAYAQLSDSVDSLAYYSVVDRNNPEDGEGVEQKGQEGKTSNYMVKFGWDVNSNNRLEFNYDSYEDAGDYSIKSNMGMHDDEGNEFAHEKYIRPIEYTRDTLTLNHELSLGNTEVRNTLYRNEMNYASFSTTSDEVTEGNTLTTGFKVLAKTNLTLFDVNQTLRYGVEGNTQDSEKLINGVVATNSNGDASTEKADTIAVYAEDEIEVATGLFITPGIRYNYYKVDMLASDETFTDTLFALAAQYDLTNQWTIKASATELFKGPALSGSFMVSNSTRNPDLKPETGINYESGVAYQAVNIINLDSFAFSFTLFKTEIDDFIDDSRTGKAGSRGRGPYSNLGNVEIDGFESILSARKGNLSARLTYSKSDSEYTEVFEGSGMLLGQSLESEVGDSISFNLNYELPDIGLSLNWTSLYTLELDANTENDYNKDSYNVHNVTARWLPTQIDNLSISAGVENIFDTQYASHASLDFGHTDYEPGRNIKLTLSYNF